MTRKLYDLLSEHLTPRKREIFERIAANRTRYITFVLEDVYQPQNASAIFRSLESWGIQDIHSIENEHSLQVFRRVSKGAANWLSLHRHHETADNSASCMKYLKQQGYRIVATSFSANAFKPATLPLQEPVAIFLGTELTGVTENILNHCDYELCIPTWGFTESLNISVAAAVIAQTLANRLREEEIKWQLNSEEQLALKIEWARQSIHWSQYLIDMYESGELR
jgi:tRNA (guanosine-2'-O-)-methyltransferase